MTIGEISRRPVITAAPDDSIVTVARRMRDEHVGDVVVADRQRRPVGILTDRDIVVSVVAQSPDKLDALLASDVMTPNPVTARPSEEIDRAIDRMREAGIRRLPVVATDGRLEGIVTFDDLLKATFVQLSELVGLVARELKTEAVARPQDAYINAS